MQMVKHFGNHKHWIYFVCNNEANWIKKGYIFIFTFVKLSIIIDKDKINKVSMIVLKLIR